MTIMFYPHEEDMQKGSAKDRLETLLEAAERYKTIMLDMVAKNMETTAAMAASNNRLSVPREVTHAFNWQEIAKMMREIREMPETNHASRASKADHLTKLAEIYEVLRAAKMPKLEAVRLALVNEANQLRSASSSSQVA